MVYFLSSQKNRFCFKTGAVICLILCWFCGVSCILEAAGKKSLEKIRATYSHSAQQAQEQLQELVEEMEQAGLGPLAEETRKLAQSEELSLQVVGTYPREMLAPIDSALPADEIQLRTKLRRWRVRHAGDLFRLSQLSLKQGDPRFAFAVLQQVLRFNPDHQNARKIMGYRGSGREWITPFEAKMEREHKVFHERFGWILEDYVERYEAGERRYGGKWISAARENEIRRDFNKAWQIKSEHFLVKTNHSLERGVDISRKLEAYYEFFHNTYFQFFTTPQQIAMLFDGKSIRSYNHPHEVHYYRDKEEYVNRLKKKLPQYIITETGERIPQVAITNGLYYTNDRTSYFYYDAEADNDTTLYHEATHQLFFEPTHPTKRFVPSRQHLVGQHRYFWTIEGIACYMESTTPNPDEETFTLGDVDSERFYQARYRFLNDSYYIPLREFSNMGMEEFKNHPHIARNYSQCAGLSHFFMEYEGGRYREAFIAHLTQLYTVQGRQANQVQSLETLTGVSYEELDRQYGEHMKQTEKIAKGKIPGGAIVSE